MIRDLAFPIASATLHGFMPDPYWSARWNGGLMPRPTLTLEVQAGPVEHDDTVWQPMLCHDQLPFSSRDWRAMAHREIIWTEPFDAATGIPNGNMYVFEHAAIHEGALIFGDRNGRDFDVSWRGVCDIFWDDGDFGQRVPFAATAKAHFADVRMHGCETDHADSFRERFSRYLDPEDFVQGPVLTAGGRYEDGMRTTHCVFTPKPGG